MSEATGGLKLDDKLAAENLLYAQYYERGDRKIFMGAIAGAVLIHVIFLLIHFPEIKRAVAEKEADKAVVVKKYVPPPPPVQRKQIEQQKITKKVPIPDPTPDEPEPIREPEPEIVDEIIPPDVDVMIGEPEAPPPSGPLLAGVGDVTNPVAIPETKVQPSYPELARQARVEGKVILQAVITASGDVAQLEVLRCNRPNMGFEEAAIDAVKEWKYEPALQNGRPVEVFFTVVVDFTLH